MLLLQIKVWFQNRRTKQKKDPSGTSADDDDDRNSTSAGDVESRDCGGSLASSTSESEYIDVESPRNADLQVPLEATTTQGLLDPIRRGLHAPTGPVPCSF